MTTRKDLKAKKESRATGAASAPAAEEQDILLEPKEAAERLKASIPTLARWRGRGTGPKYFKRAGRIYYSASEIDAYWRNCERAKTRG